MHFFTLLLFPHAQSVHKVSHHITQFFTLVRFKTNIGNRQSIHLSRSHSHLPPSTDWLRIHLFGFWWLITHSISYHFLIFSLSYIVILQLTIAIFRHALSLAQNILHCIQPIHITYRHDFLLLSTYPMMKMTVVIPTDASLLGRNINSTINFVNHILPKILYLKTETTLHFLSL